MAWLLMILTVTLSAATPLTDAQREQLATARDNYGQWDEPALYPLLRNTLTWAEGDAAGAMVPDYEALHRDPAAARGQLFLIEGELGAVQPIRKQLAQPGEFETNLQQWSIRVSRDPDEVVVCLMVDPMPLANKPPTGARVRLVGRFFKVWQFVDRERMPTPYLLFVGKWVTAEAGAIVSPIGTMGGKPNYAVIAVIFIMLLGAAWYALRRATRLSFEPKPLASQLRRRAELEAAEADGEGADSPPLPDDPIAALDALRQRHEADTTDDNR